MYNIDTAAALPILLKSLRLPTILEVCQSVVKTAESEGWNYNKLLSNMRWKHVIEKRSKLSSKEPNYPLANHWQPLTLAKHKILIEEK